MNQNGMVERKVKGCYRINIVFSIHLNYQILATFQVL